MQQLKYKAFCTSFLLMIIPFFAHACSVCGGSFTDDEIRAYSIITILLGLLPILSVTVFALWVYKRYRAEK